MKEQKFDYGMIGLGTMGRDLVYNMGDHAYTVIDFDKNNDQVEILKKETGNEKILEDIRSAFSQQPDLSNLLLSDAFSKKLMQSQKCIRKIIQIAVESGVPVPAIMGALAYLDSYRSGWLPANLIQAQRDDFGAHTYERNDREGIFHTHWNQKK